MRKKVNIEDMFKFNKENIHIGMSCMTFLSNYSYQAKGFNFSNKDIDKFIETLETVMLEYEFVVIEISDGKLSKHFNIKNDSKFIELTFMTLINELNNLTDYHISEITVKKFLVEFSLL